MIRTRCPECNTPQTFDDEDGLVECRYCETVFRLAGTSQYRGQDQDDDDYDDRPRRRKPRRRERSRPTSIAAVFGFILGTLSCLVFCVWFFSMPFAFFGLILSLLERKGHSPRLALAGFVLSCTGMIFGTGFMVATIAGITSAASITQKRTAPPFFPAKP
ncbi:MAG: hypothetical protein ACRC8S_09190 [Fimbriiglobus sp.]